MKLEKSEELLLAESGINPTLIRSELRKKGIDTELSVFYESDSTSREARDAYELYGRRSLIVVADGQTAGRGRRGRSFLSPHGRGIYMSLLISPDSALGSFTAVTGLAAVAVCRAIERCSGILPDIKWVNDICYKGKKLGGILTEGVLAEESLALLRAFFRERRAARNAESRENEK